MVLILATRVTEHLYDTGFYHLPLMKWFKESRVAFGLGHLHGNFGFNSIWFGLGSLIWSPISFEGAAFTLNTILSATFLLFLIERLEKHKSGGVVWIFSVLSLIFLTFPKDLGSAREIIFDGIGSLNTDTPAALFTILVFIFSFECFEESPRWESLLLAFISSLMAAFIKLSHVVVLILPFWILIKERKIFFENISRWQFTSVFLSCFSFGIIWLMRGFITSGCPAYPSTLMCIQSFEWTVPMDLARASHNWVKAWAREPGVPPEIILKNWDWFETWFVRFLRSRFRKNLLYFIFIGIFFIIYYRKKKKIHFVNYYPHIFVSLLALVFWFLQAPDIRFAFGFWLSFSIMILTFGIAASGRLSNSIKHTEWLVTICLATLLLSESNYARLHNWIKGTSFPNIPDVEYEQKTILEGFAINAPINSDRCWNAPRPCAVGFDIRIFQPSDLVIETNRFYPMIKLNKK